MQSQLRIIRSANRKFRKREATNRSCRNSFWKVSLANVFHAIVSVIAVNIQLSSPSIVLLSPNWPGIFSSSSRCTLGPMWPTLEPLITNHLRATLMGVVRQEEKRSAGSSGAMGSSWSLAQAASWMQERREGGEGTSAPVRPPVAAPCLRRSKYSLSCCSAKFLKLSTIIPALLQSYLQNHKVKPSKNVFKKAYT